jgi:outer membrane immunogenic protein
LGGIVLGVEADFSGTVWKGSQTILTEFDFPPVIEARSSYSSDMDWLGTVRARIGFLPTPTLLAYITGGFAFGKVEQSLSVVADNDPGSNDDAFAGSDSATETGWTVGGGVEWAIVPRVSFKAEYLYFNLGDLPAFQTGPAGGGCNATNCLLNVTSGDEIEGHLGRIGVNFQLQ